MMVRGSLCKKKLCIVIMVCAAMACAMLSGCENSDSTEAFKGTNPEGNVASPTPKKNIKQKALKKIEAAVEENAEKVLKDKAERIPDSIQELDKTEDGKYYYGYTEGELKISIETDGFEKDNHGKYQLLDVYRQNDGQVYIAVLRRTEDEKVYGEVYRYLG